MNIEQLNQESEVEEIETEEQPEITGEPEQALEGQPEETQAEKDWKEEYEKRDKSYKELQSLHGRSSKEIGELRQFKKQMEPYMGYLEQVAEQQKQQRYQQDPQAQVRDYMESQLAPFREMQVEQEANKTVTTLQSELGENYETLAPIMANVLKHYQEEAPEVAEYLASNPIVLVRQAAGDLYLHQMKTNKQQAIQSRTAKQSAVRAMGGVARGGVAGRTTTGDFSSLEPQQMLEQLRKMGASIRPEE